MSEMSLNLLPSRAKFQAAKILWNSRINRFMVWLVVVWLIMVVVVFGLNVYISFGKKSSDDKLATTTADYSTFDTTIQNGQRLKYKAKLVGEVLASRFEYSKAFKGANDFFPDGVSMTKFTIADDKTLKLEGMAQNKDIEKIEDQIKLVNSGQSKIYKKSKITSLVWTDGFWKFTVEVSL